MQAEVVRWPTVAAKKKDPEPARKLHAVTAKARRAPRSRKKPRREVSDFSPEEQIELANMMLERLIGALAPVRQPEADKFATMLESLAKATRSGAVTDEHALATDRELVARGLPAGYGTERRGRLDAQTRALLEVYVGREFGRREKSTSKELAELAWHVALEWRTPKLTAALACQLCRGTYPSDDNAEVSYSDYLARGIKDAMTKRSDYLVKARMVYNLLAEDSRAAVRPDTRAGNPRGKLKTLLDGTDPRPRRK